MGYNQRFKPDHRKGPDALIKWIKASQVIVWFVLFIFIFTIDQAKPREVTLFDRLFNIEVYPYWDQKLVLISFYIIIVLFVFSLISLIMNLRRLKRKDDYISKSLFINLVFSLIGILIYVLKVL